jgi:hypothetical protein
MSTLRAALTFVAGTALVSCEAMRPPPRSRPPRLVPWSAARRESPEAPSQQATERSGSHRLANRLVV